MLADSSLRMVFRVCRRELTAFMRLKALWLLFGAQPVIMAAMMGAIFHNLRPALLAHPEMVAVLVTRQFTSLLVGFGFVSVLHLCQKTVAAEKAGGMMDTLLSTPLTIGHLIWGKALYLSVLGYGVGLTLTLLNLAVLCWTLDSGAAAAAVPAYSWAFALVAAPFVILGVTTAVVTASLLVSDVRVVVVPFTLAISALVGVSAWGPPSWTDERVALGLTTIGGGGYLLRWLTAGWVTRERVLSR